MTGTKKGSCKINLLQLFLRQNRWPEPPPVECPSTDMFEKSAI